MRSIRGSFLLLCALAVATLRFVVPDGDAPIPAAFSHASEVTRSVAATLGWHDDSSEAARLRAWVDDHRSGQRTYFEQLRSEDRTGRGAMAQAFNAAEEERRETLIRTFGADAAEQIVRRVHLRRADEVTGAQVRVAFAGRPLVLAGPR